MRLPLAVAGAAVVALSVAACSGTTTKASTRGATAESSVGTVAANSHNAAAAIHAKISTVTKVLDLTAASDPNHLLGRPTGYSAAAIVFDSRAAADCDDADPGVDCGATVEQWPDGASAKHRMNYIQTMLKDAPMLGTEYDYVRGDLLVRVTGTLAPVAAKAIAAAVS